MSERAATLSPTASRLWPRLRRPAQLLALLLWIGATARLVAAGFGDGALELPRVRRPLKPGVTEFRALLAEKPVGTVRTEVSRLQPDGWRVRTETDIGGLPGNNTLRAHYDIELDADFEARHLRATADTRFGTIRAEGAPRADGSLEVKIQIDKESVTLTLPPGTGGALSEGLLQNVAVRDLVPGRRYRVPLINPGTGTAIEATVEVQNVDIWPEGRLFHLLIRQGDSAPLRAQVYENGEVLMQELPFGVTLVRQTPDERPAAAPAPAPGAAR